MVRAVGGRGISHYIVASGSGVRSACFTNSTKMASGETLLFIFAVVDDISLLFTTVYFVSFWTMQVPKKYRLISYLKESASCLMCCAFAFYCSINVYFSNWHFCQFREMHPPVSTRRVTWRCTEILVHLYLTILLHSKYHLKVIWVINGLFSS